LGRRAANSSYEGLVKRDGRISAARSRPLGAAGPAPADPATEPGADGLHVSGLIRRLGAGLLPLVGMLVAPLLVTGYVGLTVLALPVLGLRSLRRTRLD
jgi:hypothetical protein